MDSSSREQLIHIAYSYVLPKALRVAAKLKIADCLVDGPHTSEQLAKKLNLHENALMRLLKLLEKHAVFATDSFGRYQLTPLSELMVSTAHESVRDLLVFSHDVFSTCLDALDYTLETGEPGCKKALNMEFFPYLQSQAGYQELFDKGMSNYSAFEEETLSSCVDYSQYHTIMDIGCGQGGLLRNILIKNSGIQGVFCDQSHVIEHTQKSVLVPPAGFATRSLFKPCDFFQSVPSDADLYILKRVLHDWDDENALIILNNIANAMSIDAMLMVFESVINENTPEFKFVEDVLIMSITKGRERTEQQFRDLFARSPFRIEGIYNNNSLLNCIILSKVK
ncbi:O-methyltransferase [Legionella geestiana]|uniref:O-methyltransferase n=2 Tax=Legionella geestiana TaxID=45065 RepID=A0A0W0UAJ4_9GAMM|nr:methyltransferase [Legionella geestiana]KTD04826.1 O-methyltransferase [Legionella geestiana]QDQ38898.1 hypothetical protein E3226_000025 [Legionella geestiana]STX54005.1 O-methyltransferase [Legionella geestiana]